jgi:hypothetical protein
MHPFTGFYLHLRSCLCQCFDLFSEDARGIDDMTGAHNDLPVAQVVAHMCATDLAIFGNERANFGVVGNAGAILYGGTQDRHRQASIVGLAIVVDKAFLEIFRHQGRSEPHDIPAAQAAVPLDVMSPGQAIVEPEADIKDKTQPDTPGRGKGQADRVAVAFIDGQHKAHRVNEKWRVFQQQPTLNQGFTHQSEVEVGQVANAAMHQLGRFATRAAGEVPLFNERYPVTTRNRIQGDSGPCHAPTNHQHVELLALHERKIAGARRR